ncbi:hypothetical protein PENSPDRAFT_669490 [Peniophora sp. CONT]|nr:hypothetical protein PENSPDRAFT_669490 [Peniophora sp. CONT]
MAWVNITYVCGQWRRFAIATPLLWTDINGALGSRWIDAFIQRSKEAPITFGNRDRESTWPIHYGVSPVGDFKEVVRVIPTIWHLYGGELPQAILDCLAIPNTVIKRYELTGDADTQEQHNVTRVLFAGAAPLLRHFFCALKSISLPWSAVCISELRSLVISCTVGLPPLLELVDAVLRRLHRIEWLDLADLPITAGGIMDSQPPPIELPYMNRLGLQGNSESVAYVYQCLRVPEEASIELRCEGRGTAAVSRILQFIFPAVHSRYSEKLSSAPTTVYVNTIYTWGGRGLFYMSAWPTMTSTISDDLELDPPYVYNTRPSSILLKFESHDGNAMLGALFNVMPLCRATRLHAATDADLPPSSHARIFFHAVNIETLYIGRSVMDEADACHQKLKAILDALLLSARAVLEGREPLDRLLLPILHQLHVGLDIPGTWHRHASDSAEDGTLMEKLRELVATRAAVGAPLRSIRIVPESLKAEIPSPRSQDDDPPEGDPVTVPDEVRALLEA